MSITSKATVFPGSDIYDDISFDDPTGAPSLADTPALSTLDGSRSGAALKSISALSTRADPHGHHVVALNDSRGASGEVGIAAICTLTQKTVIIELSDTPRFTRTLRFLAIHEPCLVLCCDAVNSRLGAVLGEAFKGAVPIQRQPRAWFSEREGRKAVEQFALPSQHESLLVTLDQRFYCLASLGALMHWIEDGGDQIKAKSLDIQYSAGEEGVMIIDYHSSKLLEIVKCSDTGDSGSKNTDMKRCSLLAAVNTCKTPMGTRMLRCNLLQPLTDVTTIKLRQETATILQTIDPSLKLTIEEDIDRTLSAMIWTTKKKLIEKPEKRIHFILIIKQILQNVEELNNQLKNIFANELLESIIDALDADCFVSELLEKISAHVDEDIGYGKGALPIHQRCFAVKVGVDSLLDVARKTFAEITEDILEYIESLRTKGGLPISPKYDPKKGYSIQVSLQDGLAIELAPEMIVMKKTNKTMTITTLDLLKMNQRLCESLQEIFMISDQLVQNVYEDVMEAMGNMYRTSEAIALFDMLMAMANYDGVEPQFSTDDIAVVDFHHPILYSLGVSTVPNDWRVSQEELLMILTGANMSGKSTFLRQVALTAILCQVGFRVKAESARVRIFDRLYTRIGNDDDLDANISTFSMEMLEMADITKSADSKSLVIIDELGRGTSTVDGTSIACAICRHLLEHNRCLSLMATHYTGLVEYLSGFPAVKPSYLNTDLHDYTSKHTFKLQPGIIKDTPYGITLARQIGLAESLLRRAESVRRQLADDSEFSDSNISKRAFRRRKLIMITGGRIQDLLRERENMDDEMYSRLLTAIKRDFISEMNM